VKHAPVTAARNQTPRSIAFTQNAGTLAENGAEAWRMATSCGSHALTPASIERVAAAEMQTRLSCNPHLKVEAQDRFFAANGVRRGDDKRGEAGK
jgi:hypothetical protein